MIARCNRVQTAAHRRVESMQLICGKSLAAALAARIINQ